MAAFQLVADNGGKVSSRVLSRTWRCAGGVQVGWDLRAEDLGRWDAGLLPSPPDLPTAWMVMRHVVQPGHEVESHSAGVPSVCPEQRLFFL
jgi:hypothetical protein